METNYLVKISEEQLQRVIDEVKHELSIRCFPPHIVLSIEQEENKRGDETKLIVKSTPFTTVPNVHGEMIVTNGYSYLCKKEGENFTRGNISVYVSYEGNARDIFSIYFKANDSGKARDMEIEIKNEILNKKRYSY